MAGDPVEPPEAKKLKNKIKGHLGHLSKELESWKGLIDLATATKHQHSITLMREIARKCSGILDKCRELTLEANDLEPDNTNNDKILEGWQAQYDVVFKQFLVAEQTVSTPVAAATQPVAQDTSTRSRAVRPRPNDPMKPVSLAPDAKPAVLRAWTKRFTTFYKSHYMNEMPLEEQHIHFFSCLTSTLEARMNDVIRDNTPVLPMNDQSVTSCLELLEQEFLISYPLVNRRHDFFTCTQSHNQKLTDYLIKLVELAEEADLASLKKDEMILFQGLAGTTHTEFRENFLRGEVHSLEKLKKMAQQYMTAESSVRGLKEASKVNLVQNKADGKGSQQGLGKPCTHCTKPLDDRHTAQNCYHKTSKCRKCGQIGHIRPACPKKSGGDWSKKDTRKKDAKSRSAEAEDEDTDTAAAKAVDSARSNGVFAGVSVVTSGGKVLCHSDKGNNRPTPRMNIEITDPGNNRLIESSALPDTGATQTIVSPNKVRLANLKVDPKGAIPIIAADGLEMKCEGSTKLEIHYEHMTVRVTALVSSTLKDEVIVSWHDLVELGVLPKEFPRPVCSQIIIPQSDIKAAAEVLLAGKSSDVGPLVTSPDGVLTLDELMNEYSDVLSNTLEGRKKDIVGGPMTIHLTDEPIRPNHITKTKPIPRHWQQMADDLINELTADRVIIPVTDPTAWINKGFFVPKPNNPDALRLVTDLRKLNSYTKRPIHPFPTPKTIRQNLDAGSKVFCTMDATHGYFQIPLTEESSKLTTFLVPQGRFRYACAPMGCTASSDEWCRRSDLAISGIKGVQKCVDDILISAPDEKTLLERIEKVLAGCRQNGITISRKKLKIGTEVKFAGFIINGDGVKPNPEKVKAIKEFPKPTCVSELRSFFGMVNQFDPYAPDLAQAKDPLNELLRKEVAWVWLPDHDEAFERVKGIVSDELLLHHFDDNLETELLTDAARLHGLGYALIQRDEGKVKLLDCSSRTLSSAERNYATIELEALAIAWAMQKSHFYLRACPQFKVLTDHRPLVGIFKKDFDDVTNSRLQRIIMRTQCFNFSVEYTPGKGHLIADSLSRHPIWSSPEGEEDSGPFGVPSCVASVMSMTSLRADVVSASSSVGIDINLLEFIEKAKLDEPYQKCFKAFREMKEPKELSQNHPVQEYRSVWNEISSFDEHPLLVKDGHKIVVPKSLRQEVLKLLHTPHVGMTGTNKQAQQLYYWPGMKNDIKLITESCEACQEHLASQKKQPLVQTIAERPFQMLSADLGHESGNDYLIICDRYSGFPWIEKLTTTTSLAVCNKFKRLMNELAFLPQSIRTDGGPQFRTEFDEFCKAKGIAVEHSSPNHHQSNGHAESAVKSVKKLLMKCEGRFNDDFFDRLRHFRNTPRADGFSPAQMLVGRRLKTELPVHPQAYAPINTEEAELRRQLTRDRAKDHHDRTARSLPHLSVGSKVIVQNARTSLWDKYAIVVSSHQGGRSYLVRLPNGRLYYRNRLYLRPCP